MKKIEVQTYCGDDAFDSIREAQRWAKDLSSRTKFRDCGVKVSVDNYFRYVYVNGRAIPEDKWCRYI